MKLKQFVKYKKNQQKKADDKGFQTRFKKNKEFTEEAIEIGASIPGPLGDLTRCLIGEDIFDDNFIDSMAFANTVFKD